MSDNETRQKLIDSAKKEFFENGFAKASLRKICTNAGVTTGALYFFFKNKDDLFSAIVAPPLLKLKEMLIKHNREDEEYLGSPDEQTRSVENQLSTHKEAVTMVGYLYDNYDAFLLLLTKSQGSVYENCVDEFVALMEEGFRTGAEALLKNMPGCRIDEYMLHWLAHMDIEMFIHLLTHVPEKEKGLAYAGKMIGAMVKMWFDLLFVKDE